MKQTQFLVLVIALFLQNFISAQVDAVGIEYEIPSQIEAGTPFIITLKLNRASLTGIARIQQSWPRGFTLNEMENAGAIFSFSKTQLQFLWVTLPTEKIITLKYEVLAGKEYSGKLEIPGVLIYLDGSQRKEIPFPPLKLDIKGKGTKSFEKPLSPNLNSSEINPIKSTVAINSGAQTKTTTPIKKENPPAKTEKKEIPKEAVNPAKKEVKTEAAPKPIDQKKNPIKQENKPKDTEAKPAKKEETPTTLNTSTSTSKSLITFRIQLAAVPQKVDKESIARDFNVDAKELQEESHNGLFKYTFGEFPSLVEARKKMNTNPKMKGKAFITGYRNNIRIDLEEAIRLSKEK